MSSRSGWCALLLLVTSAASAQTHPDPEITVTRLPVRTEVPPVTSLTPLPDRSQNALPDSGEALPAKARRKPRKERIEPPGLLSKQPRR